MIKAFIEAFSQAAKAQGIQQLDFYVEEAGGSNASVYEGQLESMTQYHRTSVFIEGEYQGFQGTAYTEELTEAGFPFLLTRLKETALENRVAFSGRELPTGSINEPAASGGEDVEGLLEAEAAARKDARIQHVQCQASHGFRRIILANQSGAMVSDCQSSNGGSIFVVAREGDNTQTGSESLICSGQNAVNMKELAVQAREGAVGMLHSRSLPSGASQVILGGGVIREMLSMYIASFYGQSLLDNKSMLKGKKGQKIAAFPVTLSEEPKGILSRSFDDEGTPCTRKDIIKDGLLTGWLHNKKSSKAMEEQMTGNGFKREYLEDTATGHTNLLLKPGTASLEELFGQLGSGLYITECDGMFAGANPVSGDFALISKGYVIEDGRKGQAVSQITIAGNFFQLLKEVKALADDSQTERFGKSTVTAPAVWAGELSVSGKAE